MQKTDVYKIRNMLGSIAEYIFATILILDCRTMYGYMNNNSYSSVTMLLAISVSCILQQYISQKMVLIILVGI